MISEASGASRAVGIDGIGAVRRTATAGRSPACAAVALAVLAGCGGDVGTLQVSLVTAPDSTLMDQVQRLRVTLDEPPTVVEAERTGDGFIIDLEVDAEGITGFLIIEGFDADDAWVAFGRSGPLPIAAIDAQISIYLAPPLSIAAAPEALDPPRSEIAVTPLSYGVAFAGGRNAGGAPVGDLAIYNLYDHALQIGLDAPVPFASATAMTGTQGAVFVFGGLDSADQPTANLWFFDTNVAPSGAWADLQSDPDLARAGSTSAPLGFDQFLVSGDPLVQIDGEVGRAVEVGQSPLIDGGNTTVGSAVILNDIPNTLFAGAGAGTTGAVLVTLGTFNELATAPAEVSRTGHGAAVLPDGDTLIVGGQTLAELPTSAVRYFVRDRTFSVLPSILATARTDAAVTATGSYIVVAGGRDGTGQVLGDAEILDADTLQRVAVLPLLVPRAGAAAETLANGQVLIAGGVDADGAPIATLELFTPDR